DLLAQNQIQNVVRLQGLKVDVRGANGLLLVAPTKGYTWVTPSLLEQAFTDIPLLPLGMRVILEEYNRVSKLRTLVRAKSLPRLTDLCARAIVLAGPAEALAYSLDTESIRGELLTGELRKTGLFPRDTIIDRERERLDHFLVEIAVAEPDEPPSVDDIAHGFSSVHEQDVEPDVKLSRASTQNVHERRFGKGAGTMVGCGTVAGTQLSTSFETFNRHTKYLLERLDSWEGILVAGGCVLSWIRPWILRRRETPKQRQYGDIDVYVLEGSGYIQRILSVMKAAETSARQLHGYGVCYVASSWAVTAYWCRDSAISTSTSSSSLPLLQVITKKYQSTAELLSTFDVDCCGVAYDGHRVIATARAVVATQTRINVVDGSRASPTYEPRLAKYCAYGCSCFVPQWLATSSDKHVATRRMFGPERLLLHLHKRRNGKASNASLSSSYAPILAPGLTRSRVRLAVRLHNTRLRDGWAGVLQTRDDWVVCDNIEELEHHLRTVDSTKGFATPDANVPAHSHDLWL
ncbi:hypothetical protein HDU93_003631, partial [Gonapodya sp. JEL0774]